MAGDTIRAATAHDRMQRVLAFNLGVANDALDPAQTIRQHDGNVESLDLVELVMEIEDEFSIEINDEDAERLSKSPVQAYYDYIETRKDIK